MFSYVTLGSNDLVRAIAFYDAVLAPLGHQRFSTDDQFVGWGVYEGGLRPTLWLCRPFDGAPASPGNGTMVSLLAPDRATVDAVHAAALAHGGHDEGPPGLRPHYGPHFYAGYMRDPDGNKLNAVCYAAP